MKHVKNSLALCAIILICIVIFAGTSEAQQIWTKQTSGTTATLTAIAYGNGTYVAVGDSGTVLTSPDGITWTKRTAGSNQCYYKGAVFLNNKFVLAADSIIGYYARYPFVSYVSSNGISWTKVNIDTSSAISNFITNGNAYLATGNNAYLAIHSIYQTYSVVENYIYYSSDGLTWALKSTIGYYNLSAICYGNGTYVTGSSSVLYTSPDVSTWTQHSSIGFHDIIYANNQFITCGNSIQQSADGITWITKNTTITGLNRIIYGGSYYVAVGTSGKVAVSSDAATWTATQPVDTNGLNGITYGNHLLVAVGNNGTIIKSVVSPDAPVLVSPANNASISSTATLFLSWTTTATAVTYHIQGSTSSSFSTITIEDSTLTTASKTITYLPPDITYYWRVRAKNAGGAGSWSSIRLFTVVSQVPNIPSIVSPTSGTTGVVTTMYLTWSTAAYAATYRIQISTSSAFATLLKDSTGLTATSLGFFTLSTSTTYYWRVCAINGVGSSNWSASAWFTTGALPGTPVITYPANGATNVTFPLALAWNSITAATSYRIQVAIASSFTSLFKDTMSPTTSSVLSAPSSNTTYYWRVCGVNGMGSGGWSSIAHFTTLATPVAPTLISPVSGARYLHKTVTMTWSLSLSATSYRYQVATTSSFASLVKDTTLSVLSYTLYLMKLNTVYFWRVCGVNYAGQGSWSAISTYSTISDVSSVTLISPATAAITKGDTILLQWNIATQSPNYYAVQMGLDSTMTVFIVNTTNYTDTAMTVKSLTRGLTYWWRVKAYNDSGWGNFSSQYKFTVSNSAILPVSITTKTFSVKLSAAGLYYTLPSGSMVEARLFDIRGRCVAMLVSLYADAGSHSVALPAQLTSGNYLLSFKTASNSITTPVVLIK